MVASGTAAATVVGSGGAVLEPVFAVSRANSAVSRAVSAVAGALVASDTADTVATGTPQELQKRAPESARSAPQAAQFVEAMPLMSAGIACTLTAMTVEPGSCGTLTRRVRRARVLHVRRSTDRDAERGAGADVPEDTAEQPPGGPRARTFPVLTRQQR
jgi:hypothetical protein